MSINTQFVDKLNNAAGLFIVEENSLEVEQIPCQIIYEDSLEGSEPFFGFINNGYEGLIDVIYLKDIKSSEIIYEDNTKTYVVKRNNEKDLKVRFFYIA